MADVERKNESTLYGEPLMFTPQNTECKTCIFRDGFSCRLDKIDFYKTKNIKITPTLDGNILSEFICPYYRTTEWLEEHQVTSDLVGEIRKENAIPYLPILLFMEYKLLESSLQKISKFNNKPTEVFIILNADSNLKIIDMVERVLTGTGIHWHIHFEVEDNSWHNIFKFYNRREFLLLIKGYPEVNNNWPKILTSKIQDELYQFAYAENKSQTMMLIPAPMYKNYYFEYTVNFVNKLRTERYKQKCVL